MIFESSLFYIPCRDKFSFLNTKNLPRHPPFLFRNRVCPDKFVVGINPDSCPGLGKAKTICFMLLAPVKNKTPVHSSIIKFCNGDSFRPETVHIIPVKPDSSVVAAFFVPERNVVSVFFYQMNVQIFGIFTPKLRSRPLRWDIW